ncbi:DUF2569 family protein [Labilibacter marinus]|uniref:DUF2569 family protein n=1 Tax=Labilibacter marinus TaxID=1477105 RepID=UPI00082E42C8|nr:DUF2569 family protein [Labilibacter marinus]
MRQNRIITAIILLLSVYASHTSAQFQPKWAKQITYDKNYTAHSNQQSDGYTFLLSDSQINLVSKEYYHCLAYRITEEIGLRNVSSITLDYDSEYQKLQVNHIHIIRGQQTIDVLKLQKPEILRREKSLEKGITDGELTWYLEVNDLRIGDILEYSYTLTGDNPIKKDFAFLRYYQAFGVPVGKINVCIITDNENKYAYKLTNGANEPKLHKQNGLNYYSWLSESTQVITHEDNEPSWFDPYPSIYFYRKSSWNKLAKHMLSLYTSNKALSSEIKDLLKQVQSDNKTKETQALELIRYVQNNVRYLGNENGIYSYKPRHPNTILNKKSGDCKEKSWLLCTMLRELGFTSYPVLVHTNTGYKLNEYPPSLESFNHCVCCFINNGDTIYVDPTISNQGGDINNICFPDYYYGLLIDDKTKQLSSIPTQIFKETLISETYDIKDLKGDAKLHVKTIYKGVEADYQRSTFKNSSAHDMQSGYLEFYAYYYPNIDTINILNFEDDLIKNEFTVYESYQIKDFWEVDDPKKPRDVSTTFYPNSLRQMLNIDVDPRRETPMRLNNQRLVQQTIIVNLPKRWSISNSQDSIIGPGFQFNESVHYANKKLTLNYTHKTKQAYINKDDYKTYIEKNDKVSDRLSYGIVYYGSSNGSDSDSTASPIIYILGFLIATIAAMLAYKFYFYNPPVNSAHLYSNTPVGGWLVLPAIGISLSPIIMTYNLFTNGFFELDGWEGIINQATSNYSAAHSSIVFFEFSFNVIFIVFSILANILFHSKRSSAPLLMIIFYVSNSVFIILDSILVSALNIETDSSFTSEIIKAMIRMAIWVPYFLNSERVKETFTVRLKKKEVIEVNTELS